MHMWEESNSGAALLIEDKTSAIAEILPPSGVLAVARIKGASARDVDGLFDQISTAFKFPSWFGWNWNALSDCLRDLSWLPADRYAVVIEDLEQVLVEDSSYRKELFRVLSRAANHWMNPLNSPGSSKVVFQTFCIVTKGNIEKLEAEIQGYVQ